MEESLTVGTFCSPTLVWITPTANGTIHHGDYNFMLHHLSGKLPRIRFHYYDYASTKEEQLIEDGVIDVSFFAHELRPYDGISSSAPIIHTSTHIYTAREYDAAGQVISGVFDWPSYLLLGLATLILALLLGLMTQGDWVSGLESAVRSLLRQTIRTRFERHHRRIVSILLLASTFVTNMYGSVIMSRLTIKKELNVIDSLEQLISSSKKVYVHEFSLLQFANSEYYLEQLRDRMEVFSLEESEERFVEIYDNVIAGTHALLEYQVNVEFLNNLVLPPRFRRCGVLDHYLRASPPLISTIGAWKWKDDFKYRNEFNDIALRLAAAGTLEFYLFSNQRRLAGLDTIFTSEKYDNPECHSAPSLESKPADQSVFSCSFPQPDESLSFGNMRVPFTFFLVGLGLSIATFILELVCYSSMAKKRSDHRRRIQTWVKNENDNADGNPRVLYY